MDRNDYEEICRLAERFVKDWEEKKVDDLVAFIHSDVKFYVSTCKDYTDGGRHSLNGLGGFIKEQAETSFFRLDLYNLLVSSDDEDGRFTGIICGTAASKGEWKSCQFIFNIAVKLHKEENGWCFNEVRLDLCDITGDFDEFFADWYMEENKAHWSAGVHLPMISGELDGVGQRSDVSIDILSDEEQIAEVFSRYAFGMDSLAFQYMDEVLSDDVLINMAPFGTMDKRTALQSLKLHRSSSKYWTHPGLVENIRIHDDVADVRIWRMGGHKQRTDPLVLTKENIKDRYACARYEIQMRKEKGRWKLCREDYFLGIIKIDQ